jgi:hypothetical protein
MKTMNFVRGNLHALTLCKQELRQADRWDILVYLRSSEEFFIICNLILFVICANTPSKFAKIYTVACRRVVGSTIL